MFVDVVMYLYIYYDYFNKCDIGKIGIVLDYLVLMGFVEYFV